MLILKKLLNGEHLNHQGEHYQIKVDPPRIKTVSGKCPPLYFGGLSPAARDAAAQPDQVGAVAEFKRVFTRAEHGHRVGKGRRLGVQQEGLTLRRLLQRGNHVHLAALGQGHDPWKRPLVAHLVGNSQFGQHALGNFNAGALQGAAVIPVQGRVGRVGREHHAVALSLRSHGQTQPQATDPSPLTQVQAHCQYSKPPTVLSQPIPITGCQQEGKTGPLPGLGPVLPGRGWHLF